MEQFIKTNYRTKGGSYCAKTLEIPYYIVSNYVKREKIGKVNTSIYHKNNVNIYDYLNFISPEICYFLGIIFADGFIDKKSLNLSLVENDFNKILNVLEKTYNNASIYRREREHWQPSLQLRIGSVILVNFIKEFGFKNNNLECINYIPRKYLHYFLRGYIDGDGCFFIKEYKSVTVKRFSIASTYDFNWSVLANFLDTFKIKYVVKRKIQGKNKSSSIEICNIAGIISLGNYIYQNYEIDKIGFPRKFKKFQQIKKCIQSSKSIISCDTVVTPNLNEAQKEALFAKQQAFSTLLEDKYSVTNPAKKMSPRPA